MTLSGLCRQKLGFGLVCFLPKEEWFIYTVSAEVSLDRLSFPSTSVCSLQVPHSCSHAQHEVTSHGFVNVLSELDVCIFTSLNVKQRAVHLTSKDNQYLVFTGSIFFFSRPLLPSFSHISASVNSAVFL